MDFQKIKNMHSHPNIFFYEHLFCSSYSYQKYNALDFENQCKFNQQYNHFLNFFFYIWQNPWTFCSHYFKNIDQKLTSYMIILLFSGFQTSVKTFGSDIAMLGSHEYLALLYCFCSIVHTRFTTCNLFFGTLYLTKRSLFHIILSSKNGKII